MLKPEEAQELSANKSKDSSVFVQRWESEGNGRQLIMKKKQQSQSEELTV